MLSLLGTGTYGLQSVLIGTTEIKSGLKLDMLYAERERLGRW